MSWLSGKELLTAIEKYADKATREAFHGIYSIDELPKFVPCHPFFIIINTDSHNLPGEHWKVVFIDKDKRGELFDSLALATSNMIIRWMNRFTRTWEKSERRIQSNFSTTCGAFVLYFIFKRLSSPNLERLTTANFSANVLDNERKVLAFYRGLKK